MKGLFLVSVVFAAVISAWASSEQLQRPNGEFDSSFQDVEELSAADVPDHHGNRIKRSPLDPIVAPLLIGKSFLYGALLGPKLFHRPRYYRVHHGGHGYGHGYQYGPGWGWGGYGHGK